MKRVIFALYFAKTPLSKSNLNDESFGSRIALTLNDDKANLENNGSNLDTKRSLELPVMPK